MSSHLTSVLRRLAGLAALGALLTSGSALAVPSFARQTGSDCAACHIGAYGPHLTPYGIRFKLGGYTDSDGKDGKLPLSAELMQLSEHPELPGNSHDDLVQASVYLAGRLNDNMGALVRIEKNYKNPFNPGNRTSLDHMDLRYVHETRWNDKDLLLGLSINNAPGVQDPLDVMPAWGFPVLSTDGSLLNTASGRMIPTPVMAGSGGAASIAHRVLGATASAYYDKHWYGELGFYRSLSLATQQRLGEGVAGDPGDIGTAPYWRAAYMHDLKTHFFSAGLFGMNARQTLPGATARDKIDDVGFDASYQYLGNREHIVHLRAAMIHERRDYGTTPAGAQSSGKVDERTLSATYMFRNTYGFTVARMVGQTNRDVVRYDASGTADASTNYAELMWIPLGKEDSPLAPFVNIKVALFRVHFDKFNGTSGQIVSSSFGGGAPFVCGAPVCAFGPTARQLSTTGIYVRTAF